MKLQPIIRLVVLFFLLLVSCQDNGVGPVVVEGQEKLLPIMYNEGIGGGTNFYSIWVRNRIYSTWPIRYYELDGGLQLVHDSVPFAYTERNTFPAIPDSVIKGFFSVRASSDGKTLLGVRCIEHGVSNGSLEEIDVESWQTMVLIPSSFNVSSAAYVSPDTIVYYSNGSTIGASDAGYYQFVRSTQRVSILLPYFPHSGQLDIVNGFDYSSTRKKLIIPIARQGDPSIIELDLRTLAIDTLPIHLSSGDRRWQLYLRYSHDGSRVLYCSYNRNSLSGPVYEPSEIGIANLFGTYDHKRISRPGIPDSVSIALFPDWSPNETHIVFSASVMQTEPAGALQRHQAAILQLP
jgi:hypothetical protein